MEHFDAVDSLVADHVGEQTNVDWSRVGRQMAALMARWREELQETGDIEDEDRDPVGLPPRF